ncbi:MAG: tRNA (adenosine(37)-N6)-dimethylallyltransferase MiaA [Candidatus Omnitrophica bacterium]|nr:tRNA (adenosine(37)-N6)-dimethylallyltransferase MiaA [Candidatus Omnitrophota bacterium]
MDCLALVGPTASGKTEAIELLADLLSIEVINCDSMQVYQQIPIASQVPPSDLLKKVPHHLIDFVHPSREYSVSEYVRDARVAISEIRGRKKMPVICGGTGLYFNSLMDGLFDGPSADEDFRNALTREVALHGPEFLHERLTQSDPKAAAKIHPNDIRRVIRALEVIEVTGKVFSDLKEQRSGLFDEMNIRVLGLQWPRAELYNRINLRVDQMLADGLKDEISKLLDQPLSKTVTACLGVHEIGAYLTGEATLEEATASLKQNTRRFAKRQIAWFKRDERIEWVRRSADAADLRQLLKELKF